MIPNLSDWTIVLQGSWNMAILNPDWLAKTVFNLPEIDVELLIVGVGPTMRFGSPHVHLIPGTDKIVIVAKSATDECVKSAEDVAINLLRALPVTPVSACGINFGYREGNPDAEHTKLFDIGDTAGISGERLEIKSTAITRALPFEDRLINLRLALTDDGTVLFHLNFHKAVADAASAADALKDALRFRRQAETLLKNVYKLELEGENE